MEQICFPAPRVGRRRRSRTRRHALAVSVLLAALAAAPALAQSDAPAVFILNNVSDQITSYTIACDGTLTFVGNYATSDGPINGDLTPDGRYLAVTHATASTTVEVIQFFEVNADASLMLVHATTVPDSPLGIAWMNDDVVAVTRTNTGVANSVFSRAFDPGAPSLTLVDSEPTGTFNTTVFVHPSLAVLYAQDSTGNTVRWISFTPAGVLALGGSLGTGGTFPLDLVTTRDGAYLYAAGGISNGGNKVLGYSIGALGGLTPLPGSPFVSPGVSPAHVEPSDDGENLFVGHGSDATVRSFTIAPNGALASTGFSFDVGLQGSIGDVKAMGDYLLVTDETTATDGITGVYSFFIEPDGSLTPVAPIYVTGGVRPETIVVWRAPRPGDVDGDGVTGFADLTLVLLAWGPCAPPCPEDFDGTGDVGFNDLTIVLLNWGGCA